MPTKEFADEERLSEKKFQGKRPTKRKTIYGTLNEETRKIVEKTNDKTKSWNKGFKITQA